MRTALTTTLACLGIAIALRIAFSQALAPMVIPVSNDTPRVVILQGRMDGEWIAWLIIEPLNADWRTNGYQPKQTHLISNYPTLTRKLLTGQYETIFVNQ